jgi:hypothetical protein
MKKIVKNFRGFQKVYENELNSQDKSTGKIETKPEEAKKAAELINQSIQQDSQNAPIKNLLDKIEAQSQKEIREAIDPKSFTKAISASDPQSEAELKSKVEALSKDLNVTEEMQSLYATLKETIEKNAPKHPTFGKLKYIDVDNCILHYETAKKFDIFGEEEGNIRFEVTESERKHIENILSESVAKQKTLKWLSAAAQVLGGSMFLLGIGMILYGVGKRSQIYGRIHDELNRKFGFLDTDSGADFAPKHHYDPQNYEDMGIDPTHDKLLDELERKGMISNVWVGGDDSMDTFGKKEYGYVYNWDKILTSDQSAELSSNALTFILGGAVTSGVGALSFWAGMVLDDKNKINDFLDYFTTTLKAACFTIGLPVEKLTNTADISEVLSRDFSMQTRKPGYMF